VDAGLVGLSRTLCLRLVRKSGSPPSGLTAGKFSGQHGARQQAGFDAESVLKIALECLPRGEKGAVGRRSRFQGCGGQAEGLPGGTAVAAPARPWTHQRSETGPLRSLGHHGTEGVRRRTWAQFGPNALDGPSRSAGLRSVPAAVPTLVRAAQPIPADLGVKGSQAQILSARPMKHLVRGNF
jgi:hypothetical protein